MSDIQPGDVVVCIKDVWNDPNRAPNEVSAIYVAMAPRCGTQWLVADVRCFERPEEDRPLYLSLEGQPSDKWFHASYFRKIDAPKSELSERIRACRPIRKPVEA